MSEGRRSERARQAAFTVVRMRKDAQPERRLCQIVHTQHTQTTHSCDTRSTDATLAFRFGPAAAVFLAVARGVPRGSKEKGHNAATGDAIKLTSSGTQVQVILITGLPIKSVKLVKWP